MWKEKQDKDKTKKIKTKHELIWEMQETEREPKKERQRIENEGIWYKKLIKKWEN